MPDCICQSGLKAPFYCSSDPKCNNGQENYCASCFKHHPHMPIVTCERVRELSKGWEELIEQVPQLKAEADQHYNVYQHLIEYCDHVNLTLPKNQQVKDTIKVDYDELTMLFNEAKRHNDYLEKQQMHFSVKNLLKMEPLKGEFSNKITKL